MKAIRVSLLVLLCLVMPAGSLWSAESSPAAPSPAPEPAPKDPKKADSPKQEPLPETPAPSAPSKGGKEVKPEPAPAETPAPPAPSKGGKEAKPETPAQAPKAKTEPKQDGKKSEPTLKQEPPPSEKPVRLEPEQPAAPPAKPEAPPKRPIGSLILTVKLALMADPLLFPYDIEVEMDGDKAVLSGKVASEDDKRSAAEIAQGIESVKGVVNKLEIVKELGENIIKRQDHSILQYVKERFARSETLKAAGFEVKCEQGVIFLSGKTRFQVIALEAAQAARQVPGVRAVDTTNVHLTGESKE